MIIYKLAAEHTGYAATGNCKTIRTEDLWDIEINFVLHVLHFLFVLHRLLQ